MRHWHWIAVMAAGLLVPGRGYAQPRYQLELGAVTDIAVGASAVFDVNYYWTGVAPNLLFADGVNSVSLGLRKNQTSVGSVSLTGGAPVLGTNVFKNPGFDGPTALYDPSNPFFSPVSGFDKVVGFSFAKNVGGIPAANPDPGTRINLGQVSITGDVLGSVTLELGFLRPAFANQILSGLGADLSGATFGPTAPSVVTFNVVPEPTSILALVGLVGAGASWIRRRSRSRRTG